MSNPQSQLESKGDPYKVLLDKLPKSDSRRPFVLLDRLNALLTARFQMEGKTSTNLALDHESLHLAQEFTDTVKTMFEQTQKATGRDSSETTLFVDSSKTIRQKIFEDAKAHFARGVSLYHSSNAHTLCAEYAGMLEQILGLSHQTSYDFQNDNSQLGEVIAIKAYALSMSGKSAEAVSNSTLYQNLYLYRTSQPFPFFTPPSFVVSIISGCLGLSQVYRYNENFISLYSHS